jgi:mono/diheme cytochrome c family protein
MRFTDRICPLGLCVLLLTQFTAMGNEPSSSDPVAQQVRSILSNRCFACHGPDTEVRQGGLRLDDASAMLESADSGARAVVPGKPAESELLRRILTDDNDERMPPADFGQRLLPAEVAAIEAWIAQGAKLPQHWSFVPPQRAPLPAWSESLVASSQPDPSRADVALAWKYHPVDRFVRAAQHQRGLTPSTTATRNELLRRLSLDLIGLPPTRAEVEQFESDTSDNAYEQQVDRLLASPNFGEHWARKWLDLARYADSAGYADDPARTAWGYRDWVVDALNANMSIEQFTVEQIAGDLLPHPTQQQLVATAFHRNTLTNNEGGTNDEEFRSVAIVDRVNTTLAVWMGVTMACAQCHTHKYDPFTQREYFQLYDILNQTQDADRRDESPVLELYTALQLDQREHWERRAADIEHQLAHPSADMVAGFTEWQANLLEPTWNTLQPLQLVSQRDSDVRFETEHVIQVRPTANNIVSDTYKLTVASTSPEPQRVQALGLRTIPMDDLPAGGAGTGGGNFVVTGLSAQLVSAGEVNERGERPPRPRQVHFTAAYADYAQSGFPAAHIIDKDKASGWAIGGDVATSHLLTLIPSRPFTLRTGDKLEINLEHNSSHRHHLLGSFRLEVSPSSSVAEWGQLARNLVDILQLPPAQRTTAQQRELEIFFSQHIATQNAPLRAELAKLQRHLSNLKPTTTVPIMRDLEQSARRETFVQLRGNYKALGEKVTAGVPAVFHPLPETDQAPNRLALAQWLVDRRNPLTARVWVNRVWESLFGIGIVRSSEEFGSQGDRPSHPELLDWLACELMDQQWDNKRLLKLLVTSNTYQQTSRVSPEALQQDLENVWLARGPRVRLSAEMVRDQSLALAGLLSHKMYGPPVRPPQPNLGLKAAFGSDTDWKTSDGEDRYRRGLYTTWRRSNPYPSMATFDAPSREVCTLRRDSTNTPLQALVTLNDPGFVEAAQGLARRIVLEPHHRLQSSTQNNSSDKHSSDDVERLNSAFQICTSRSATDPELSLLQELLTKARDHFSHDLSAAEQLATDPLGPVEDTTLLPELAAWTSLCNVLLNLDEVLMKR